MHIWSIVESQNASKDKNSIIEKKNGLKIKNPLIFLKGD
jgi:hypothetical protein